MLKGQAKTDYQKEYMRRRRGVRPTLDPVRPTVQPKQVYEEVEQPDQRWMLMVH